jgi:hypothetical protein
VLYPHGVCLLRHPLALQVLLQLSGPLLTTAWGHSCEPPAGTAAGSTPGLTTLNF